MVPLLLGSVAVIAGIGLMFWTHSVLGWRRLLALSDEPPHPALPHLVFAGPYRLVRHPFFFSVIMILSGVAVLIGSLRLGIPLAVVSVALLLIARRGERRLVSRFGEAYQRYQQAVPFIVRWRRPRK